jgi:hypothetical protein
LDLLVMLSVLAENGPVAELAGREVLFLEGGHVGYLKRKSWMSAERLQMMRNHTTVFRAVRQTRRWCS